MLRAVRLEQRLGFAIEPRTLDLLQQALPLLARVSGERIRNDLELIFGEANLLRIMDRLSSLGLLKAIHSQLTWDEWSSRRFLAALDFPPPEEWRLRRTPSLQTTLYGLLAYRMDHEGAKSLCRRLRLPLDEAEDVAGAVRVGAILNDLEPASEPSVIVGHLDEVNEPSLVIAWLALLDQDRHRRILEDYLRTWRHVAPLADGETLRSRGLRPGPVYRSVLQALKAAWLDGKVRNAQEEDVLLSRLLKDVKDNPEGSGDPATSLKQA
jgi:tRNA nucleotidyltransferase (CCA-adding enzyme)